MLRIFHSVMIAYFLLIACGMVVGCGYKTKPYYERDEDTKTQNVNTDSQEVMQSQGVHSIHPTSLSEDSGD
ncbi:hypothetical protein [uncultured Helicobacter sp.]|uniref:hypothetical protein n=1 Tax=uncultured Helicobacter sp. TaxID=175537 RepID=UPI00374F694C